MTKTAMEMQKIAAQKEMQDKEHKWKSSENKKDRRKDYITKGMDVAGKLLSVRKNDPAWYKRYVKDLDKFTNVPTFHRLGVPFRKGSYTGSALTDPSSLAIPGILTFHYVDVVGPQDEFASSMSLNPVNQILMRSKEQVLKSNSRSSVNWEAADLGLNLFATASILTALGEYKRMILCAQTYSATNAYLGVGLLRALGLTEERANLFITELAAHRKNYIILAQRFNNAVVAPADLTLFRRKWYLATNVFADNMDPARPQLYMFKDRWWSQLSADGSKVTPITTSVPVGTGSMVKYYYDTISAMISAIVDNADFQEMYADLRSAFADNILQVEDRLDENETISFNTEELNREQIRNIKMAPLTYDVDNEQIKLPTTELTALDIVSDVSGYLYQGTKSANNLSRNILLSAPDANNAQVFAQEVAFEYSPDSTRNELYNVDSLSKVNGDTILEITRFKFTGSVHNTAQSAVIELNIGSCGTEVVLYGVYSVFTNDTNEPYFSDYTSTCFIYRASVATEDIQYYMFKNLSLYSAFDWTPCIRLYFVPAGLNLAADNPPVCHIGDMTNTFSISHADLNSIHQACVLSELYLDSTTFRR